MGPHLRVVSVWGRLSGFSLATLIARRVTLPLALAVSGSMGCREEPPPAEPPPDTPVDRLGPQEVLPEVERVFGLELPHGMRVTSHFNDLALANGPTPVSRVAEHLRPQLIASHVELGTNSAVFPKVRVKGDASRRLLRIEIRRRDHLTSLRIRDVTPAPATHGLSEAQRWERAGRNPDGTLKDRAQVF